MERVGSWPGRMTVAVPGEGGSAWEVAPAAREKWRLRMGAAYCARCPRRRREQRCADLEERTALRWGSEAAAGLTCRE